MHNRRIGAFLLGAWITGAVLVIFASTQALANVDRFLESPEGIGEGTALENMGWQKRSHAENRQLLRFSALQYNRHLRETWSLMQIGLGAALLATFTLTAHRSRVLVAVAAAMLVITAISTFAIRPEISRLEIPAEAGRLNASTPGWDQMLVYRSIFVVLETLKGGLAILAAARLFTDSHQISKHLSQSQGASARSRNVEGSKAIL